MTEARSSKVKKPELISTYLVSELQEDAYSIFGCDPSVVAGTLSRFDISKDSQISVDELRIKIKEFLGRS